MKIPAMFRDILGLLAAPNLPTMVRGAVTMLIGVTTVATRREKVYRMLISLVTSIGPAALAFFSLMKPDRAAAINEMFASRAGLHNAIEAELKDNPSLDALNAVDRDFVADSTYVLIFLLATFVKPQAPPSNV